MGFAEHAWAFTLFMLLSFALPMSNFPMSVAGIEMSNNDEPTLDSIAV